jgi:hypothetical protein
MGWAYSMYEQDGCNTLKRCYQLFDLGIEGSINIKMENLTEI